MTTAEARIDALEERIAHQGRAIEDLSAVIAEQWGEIERLKRQLKLMDDQMAAVEHLARAGGSEPPPPHY